MPTDTRSDLTPIQRRQQLAGILARGVLRLLRQRRKDHTRHHEIARRTAPRDYVIDYRTPRSASRPKMIVMGTLEGTRPRREKGWRLSTL